MTVRVEAVEQDLSLLNADRIDADSKLCGEARKVKAPQTAPWSAISRSVCSHHLGLCCSAAAAVQREVFLSQLQSRYQDVYLVIDTLPSLWCGGAGQRQLCRHCCIAAASQRLLSARLLTV